MNLCCLLAVSAAFSRGRLAGSRRLAGAGVALGFAVTIKFWAAVPAVVLLCFLLAGEGRWRRARGYLAGLVAGFAVPAAGFAAAAPAAFAHSTVSDQVTRMGAATPMAARLIYLTGLIPVFNGNGNLDVAAGPNSAFALGGNGTMVINGIGGWVPSIVAALVCVIAAAAYLRRPRGRSPLEWFALAVTVVSVAAVSLYSAFFYHYPSFPAPWLAIVLGTAAGAAAGAARRASGKRIAFAGVTVVLAAAAALEGSQLNAQAAPYSPQAVDRLIPPGACVVTDQVSFTLTADRFTAARPGCPDILDSLATTLTLSGGVSVPGGAGDNPRVRKGWEATFGQAQYVWLTQGYRARIPWTRTLRLWFHAHFRAVRRFPGYGGSILYQRTG